mmetsp:Transcript_5827/g.14783  ORF Transcript_5827/g.14783 Transcript_5827/m.14783 type:complete len:310 (+) Transcript_5827:226-1155(+)
MPASSSMDERRVTIALCAASVRPPSARVEVQTTWLAMGTTATSSTTACVITVSTPLAREARTPQMTAMQGRPTRQMAKRIWSRILSMLLASSTELRSDAVFPKKVLPPVATTMASISPVATVEPILAMSPSRIFTGRDSPVRAAWSTPISLPWSSRQSAGTAPPSARTTRSPGTNSRPGMRSHRPLRFTLACGARLFFSASTASPALISSCHPTNPFMNWRSSSTPKSTRCSVGPSAPRRPSAALMRPTASSTKMPTQMRHAMGPVNASKRSISLLFRFSGSWLYPHSSRSCKTWSVVSPASVSTCERK